MPEPDDDLRPDALQPGGKDPAEGARGASEKGAPGDHPEESHLGDAGDPAEG